jgi:hypothetical protein
MFDVYITYDEMPTPVTVFESVTNGAGDVTALRDIYTALSNVQDALECETCGRTVLRFDEDGLVAQFAPFGSDIDDSGTILCTVCILKGAHYGHSVISDLPAESVGKHAAM